MGVSDLLCFICIGFPLINEEIYNFLNQRSGDTPLLTTYPVESYVREKLTTPKPEFRKNTSIFNFKVVLPALSF